MLLIRLNPSPSDPLYVISYKKSLRLYSDVSVTLSECGFHPNPIPPSPTIYSGTKIRDSPIGTVQKETPMTETEERLRRYSYNNNRVEFVRLLYKKNLLRKFTTKEIHP